LNTLAGVTQGTVDPSKALVSNSTKGIVSIADIRFDNLGTTSTGLTANSTLDRANPGLRVYGPGDYFYNTGTLGMTRNGIILEGAQYGNVVEVVTSIFFVSNSNTNNQLPTTVP